MIEAINRLSKNPRLREFSSFVLSQSNAGVFPDYLKIDLMEIPHLVPHVFSFDVLSSPEKLLVKYCGTKVDEFYGANMTGKCIVDYYKGEESFEQVEHIFRQGIEAGKPAYTRRCIHLVNDYVDKLKVAETVMFPCSSDTKTVNYTIGFADYYGAATYKEQYVTLIE